MVRKNKTSQIATVQFKTTKQNNMNENLACQTNGAVLFYETENTFSSCYKMTELCAFFSSFRMKV